MKGSLEIRNQVKPYLVIQGIDRVTQNCAQVNDWLSPYLVVSFLPSAKSLPARSAASLYARLFFQSDSSWTINSSHINSWNRALIIVHSLLQDFLRRKKDITLISIERPHLWKSHGRPSEEYRQAAGLGCRWRHRDLTHYASPTSQVSISLVAF